MIFEGWVKIKGIKLFCKITGESFEGGKPVLMMFPGGPGMSFRRYEYHSASFQNLANVFYFDPRGCGKSDKLPGSYTVDNYIEDAKALLDHFGIKKIFLLGTSYGSVTALGFAIRYNEMVEKLILIAMAVSYHFLEEAKHILSIRGIAKQKQVAEKLWTGNFNSMEELEEYFQIMATLYSYRKDITIPLDFNYDCEFEPLNQGFKTKFQLFDYTQQLSCLKMPILLLSGKHDWITPPSQALLIAQKIPHAKLEIFENSGHSIAVDEPENIRG